jgi:hypothetical protein
MPRVSSCLVALPYSFPKLLPPSSPFFLKRKQPRKRVEVVSFSKHAHKTYNVTLSLSLSDLSLTQRLQVVDLEST